MWCWRTTSHFRQLRDLSMRDPDYDMALYPVPESRPRLQSLIVFTSLEIQLLLTRNILSEDVAPQPPFQPHPRKSPTFRCILQDLLSATLFSAFHTLSVHEANPSKGEMKKGIFTVLFYEMPVKHNVLTLHSSANEGKEGDVTVFFGLSGTGKTTLSADPKRALIGDDEHCWSDTGIFNIEGGCYAKCIGLSAEKEPDIYGAIRFGAILENVVFDPETRDVDYDDDTLTENTRCAYPIEYIENTKIPCISSGHPKNIILLTCDARGVLPPISKLNPEQTMYHFISGYTSKMAGTEEGVTEPQATFSSCFAQPFLALHPMRYATMLAEKIKEHNADAWLLNTGWVGAGVSNGGKRCSLKFTRAILDAIHSGELAKAEFETYETFGLSIPKSCPGVPDDLLNPAKSWNGTANFKEEVDKLGKLFMENFKKYEDQATPEVLKNGPHVCCCPTKH
jgi:phosphoenolpyruvate carboxykinase (ATP)